MRLTEIIYFLNHDSGYDRVKYGHFVPTDKDFGDRTSYKKGMKVLQAKKVPEAQATAKVKKEVLDFE